MAQVIYIGQPENPANHRDESFHFGVHFRLGEPVPIDDPALVNRIRGNPFYEILEDPADGRDGNGSGGKGTQADRRGRGRGIKPSDRL